MAETVKIRKGDSTDYFVIKSSSIGVDLSDVNWICKQSVTKSGTTDTVTVNSPEYDAAKGGMLVYLKPSTTEALDVGNYIWAVEISNTSISPQYKKELMMMNLAVEAQFVY